MSNFILKELWIYQIKPHRKCCHIQQCNLLKTNPFSLLHMFCESAKFHLHLFFLFQHVSINASIYTLVVISLDRYRGILWPLKGEYSKFRAKLVLVLVWLVSISLAIPNLIVFYVSIFWVGSQAPNLERWIDHFWEGQIWVVMRQRQKIRSILPFQTKPNGVLFPNWKYGGSPSLTDHFGKFEIVWGGKSFSTLVLAIRACAHFYLHLLNVVEIFLRRTKF